jgi:hypothetical protein
MARELTHHFHTIAGTPVTVRLGNPDHESIAAFFECDESAVDFIETEDGTEIVTVEGSAVGTVEASA